MVEDHLWFFIYNQIHITHGELNSNKATLQFFR